MLHPKHSGWRSCADAREGHNYDGTNQKTGRYQFECSGGIFPNIGSTGSDAGRYKAPQRKRPCRSRALPVDLSSPSLNPLYGRAFASGAARSRYRIACCGQGNRPVTASRAHPARWNSLLDLFAARLTVPSARMHPASQAGHGPVAPALFIVRRDELLSVRTSKGGSAAADRFILSPGVPYALGPTETRHSPRNPVMARPRTPACRTTSSNAPCPPCRTPVAMGAKTFLNSARSAQGEVLPVPVRMACSSRVQRRRCKHR